MPLVDRINSRLADLRHRDLSFDDWAEYFTFGGNQYPVLQTSMGTVDQESVAGTAVAGFKGSGPIFALVLARMQAFSQVRFQWTRFEGSQPTDLFGSPELGVLERPWRGGTTSDLLARMEVHASAAGCAYVTRPRRDRLALLRPDRVTIIMGSQTDADDPSEAPDVEIIGYLHTTSRGNMTVFGPDEVAYYAPIPDPDYRFLGMSWITPVIRDLQADSLATEHKARFFVNSATPNLAIKFDASIGVEKILKFKEVLESQHQGAFNAWKTLYLGGGADPVTVGNSFKDMDYAVIQGRAESRLAAAAGVPPSWVGFAEGLQGSSLNAGNFNSARRRFSDGTMVHLWTNAATSLEVILDRPSGATLWYDSRVPFMREDAGDLAEIQHRQSMTITALVREGFSAESAVDAVMKNDFNLLKHTGLLSVQLQPPGAEASAQPATSDSDAGPSAGTGRRAIGSRKFNPGQVRDPGGENGGQWTKGAGAAATAAGKALGKMTEDAFFSAHGEDWSDEYGSPDTVQAILWGTGTASLYRDIGKGRVYAFGDVDAPAARRLADGMKWAVGHPDTGAPGSAVGTREVDLGRSTAQIGAGYDGDGDLVVKLTMPPVGSEKKPTAISMVDLHQVEELVDDLNKLADDMDSEAHTGRSQPGKVAVSG